jgi:hypothetical protein
LPDAGLAPWEGAAGSISFGESRTTRATASWPKNSSTRCPSSFRSLQARTTACCSCTRSSITCLMRRTSSSNWVMRACDSESRVWVSAPPARM